MKIFITGGLGNIGRVLIPKLTAAGHDILVLDRSPGKRRSLPEGVHRVPGDAVIPGPWRDMVPSCEAVINLAGESIFQRWTKRSKKKIHDSRIETTRNIIEAVKENRGATRILISTSATGYYGFHGDEVLTEENGPGNDFLATVSSHWEREALKGKDLGLRVVLLRFATVLSRKGGAMDQLVPLFKTGLGSRLGSGRQWFPWIHEDDIISIILFALENESLEGPVNCTSPHPITNRDFTRALAGVLKRPLIIPFIPSMALRILLGEFGSILVKGQRVIPAVLEKGGYRFQFPGITNALKDLTGKK